MYTKLKISTLFLISLLPIITFSLFGCSIYKNNSVAPAITSNAQTKTIPQAKSSTYSKKWNKTDAPKMMAEPIPEPSWIKPLKGQQ